MKAVRLLRGFWAERRAARKPAPMAMGLPVDPASIAAPSGGGPAYPSGRGLKSLWQAWLDARSPRRDTHELAQRNIYIVPSRAGLAFCGVLLVLLIASINDQLSLGFMLTFLLAGAGLASMHTTHANLRGLSLDLKPPAPAFAGEDVQLEVRLHNAGAARHGIGIQVLGGKAEEIAWTDVPDRGHATLALRYPAGARGLRPVPTLQIVTRFPLGLFRAWSVWRPAAQAWIYPQPEVPAAPFPAPAAGADEDSRSAQGLPQQGQEFEGVRLYRRGDSLRQVLWRKAALSLEQGTPPWVRETQAPLPAALWLEPAQAPALDDEARLSRLAGWVLAAERLQQPYGLRLNGHDIEPDLGALQRQRCLEQLALAP